MKETKVYTGRRNGKHAELMQKLDKALKEQHFAFVFTKQELKDHDRELVKEVCEDLTKSILNLKYVNDTREFATYVLSIIKSKQKDFEK